jgi:hypothetical protein
MIKKMVKTHPTLVVNKNIMNPQLQELHFGLIMSKIKAMMKIFVLVKQLVKLWNAGSSGVHQNWITNNTSKKISLGVSVEVCPHAINYLTFVVMSLVCLA